LRPGLLRIVEYKRDKLHQRLFSLVPHCVRLAHLSRSACTAANTSQRQKIPFENETQDQQNDEATDSDVTAADVKASTSAATIISSIFDVVTSSARSPAHGM